MNKKLYENILDETDAMYVIDIMNWAWENQIQTVKLTTFIRKETGGVKYPMFKFEALYLEGNNWKTMVKEAKTMKDLRDQMTNLIWNKQRLPEPTEENPEDEDLL